VAQPRSGRSWSEVDVELLTVLADLMAERFERSLAAETTRLAVVQLSAALESRVVLEQAKGMLAERHGGGLDDAFNSLRNAARQQRRTLREVAEEVVTRRADVAPKR
jgi:AmiR/NasT family two-component response regulator